MLKKIFTDSFIKSLTEKITQSLDKSLSTYQETQDKKLDQILNHVESLRIEVKSLDQRLTSKELKDRVDYGHMTYKVNSLENEITDKKD